MKKRFCILCLCLCCIFCFSQEIDYDWCDLPSFGYVTEEEWNSIKRKNENKLLSITRDCGDTNIGIWYVENEPEYKTESDYDFKRLIFLVQKSNRFIKALAFQTDKDLCDEILYSNPCFCGVQGYARRGKLSLIEASRDYEHITFTPIEPYSISMGAFEWPNAGFKKVSPFYFWDSDEKRIIFVDIYNEDLKSLYVPLKNPRFYYDESAGAEEFEHQLYVSSWDEKINLPLPNSTWLLKDGKATKIAE